MNKFAKIAACMMVVLFIALTISGQFRADAEKFIQEFQAVISKDNVKVGESAVITFKGKQLDVAGGNSIESIGTEFASMVKLTRVDKNKFKVTGIAPGKATLKFKLGDQEAVVKVTVAAKGLKKYGEPKTDLD